MKTILKMTWPLILFALVAMIMASCRKPDPEIERALDQLQASYRRDCVMEPPPSSMIEACAKVRETLGRYGR